MHSIELLSENFHNDMNTEHTDLSNYSKHCESVTWRKKMEIK